MAKKSEVEAAKQQLSNAMPANKVIGGRQAKKDVENATAKLQALTGLGWK
ncbi:hypothetical protein OG992_33635 [Micromonospora sp. NBC_00362]|nr:hypothetical protein [Micromonospora sp. NBC_00362]MCX5122101.1 hypothetical protein [Micromonospora sp. NBC_00362]